MSMTTRLKAAEAALAKKNGETGCKVVIQLDGETDDEARKRLSLVDWKGALVFISKEDTELL